MKTHTYKTAGPLALQADVYGADATGSAPKPAILWIHGGALIMGDRSGVAPNHLDRYLDAGFVVFAIDYRLAPETKLPLIAEDVEDAIKWLRATGSDDFGIDPDRLAIVGHSAGGYLTLLAGHRVTPAPQALVSFYGYGDIIGDWYSRPDPFYNTFDRLTEANARSAVGGDEKVDGTDPARHDFYLWCRQNGRWPIEIGGRDPETDAAFFTPYSPADSIQTAEPRYPPTLLLHGDADTDVPYAQSVHMAGKLADAGIAHELITIPNGPHGFDHNPEIASSPEVADAFDSVMAFLSKHA